MANYPFTKRGIQQALQAHGMKKARKVQGGFRIEAAVDRPADGTRYYVDSNGPKAERVKLAGWAACWLATEGFRVEQDEYSGAYVKVIAPDAPLAGPYYVLADEDQQPTMYYIASKMAGGEANYTPSTSYAEIKSDVDELNRQYAAAAKPPATFDMDLLQALGTHWDMICRTVVGVGQVVEVYESAGWLWVTRDGQYSGERYQSPSEVCHALGMADAEAQAWTRY